MRATFWNVTCLIFLFGVAITGMSSAMGDIHVDLSAPFVAVHHLTEGLDITGGLAGQAKGIRRGTDDYNAQLSAYANEMDGFKD